MSSALCGCALHGRRDKGQMVPPSSHKAAKLLPNLLILRAGCCFWINTQ